MFNQLSSFIYALKDNLIKTKQNTLLGLTITFNPKNVGQCKYSKMTLIFILLLIIIK